MFSHALDMKSGPLPPGGWDDSRRDSVGGEGDREVLLENAGPGDFPKAPRSYKAELSSILLLLFLYVLQGIPLGLAGSIPLILQSKNVSYTDQAFFSFVFWPFSLKLLWAPLVDAVYFKNFGRRKSWLVPTQYTLGIFMIYLSTQVDHLLGNIDGRTQGGGAHRLLSDACSWPGAAILQAPRSRALRASGSRRLYGSGPLLLLL